MSRTGISIADGAVARLFRSAVCRIEKVKIFEMAESGHTFEFPVGAREISVRSTAIACSDSEADAIGER